MKISWNKQSLLKNLVYSGIFFSAIILATILQSCGDSSTEPVNTYDYAPLAIGQYQVYEVNEVVYSSGQKDPVARTWQERDEVSRLTTNTEGITTYIISRSSRSTPAGNWQKIKEYSIEQFPDKLIFNIDNQITVPLVFPIDARVKWNGNMYNTLDKEDYTYEDIHQPYQADSLSFDQTLTVIERRDTTSVIDYALGLKRYALGIGLIYDEQTAYEYCQATSECIGQKIIDSGSRKTRKIIGYGKL